ncbi:MAG TPA: hypothetical protein VIG48_09305 [Jatrophihabitans sp.]
MARAAEDADDDPVQEDAPPIVVGAVAAGVTPLPFLAVYTILFIARGTVHPVTPPDVGHSKTAELVAGLIALALFVVGALAAHWLLDGRRRWPFMVGQFALLVTSVYFLIDRTSGSATIPVLLTLTSLTALVLASLPATWVFLRQDVPGWLQRAPFARSQERIP